MPHLYRPFVDGTDPQHTPEMDKIEPPPHISNGYPVSRKDGFLHLEDRVLVQCEPNSPEDID